MAQSFQVFGSQGEGRPFGRRPIVLARLPRVGVTTRTAPVPEPPQSPPALSFAEATRFYVDTRHHDSSIQEPFDDDSEHEERPAVSHRRHHASHRRPRPEEVRGARLHEPEPELSFTAKLAQYSGYLTTLLVAASAVVLYWIILMPNNAPQPDFRNRFDTVGAAGNTQVEIPYFELPAIPAAQPHARAVAPALDPVFTKDEAPAPKTEPAAISQPVAVVSASTAPTAPSLPPLQSETAATPAAAPVTPTASQAAAEVAGPQVESRPELTPLPAVDAAPAGAPEEIYNDASACVYPITDHPLAAAATVTGRVDAAPDDGAMFFSVPQMAQQPGSTMMR